MSDSSKVLDSEQLKKIENELCDIALRAHSISQMVADVETSENAAGVVAITDMARVIGMTADALSHQLTGCYAFGNADHWLGQKAGL
jgi:hypothetical protein